MTPHERRARELEALRRVIADCESQIKTAATIAPATVAATFEQHMSLLPAESHLRQEWQALAVKLRHAPTDVIDRAKLRRVVERLQRKADDLALWLERRDARLRTRS